MGKQPSTKKVIKAMNLRARDNPIELHEYIEGARIRADYSVTIMANLLNISEDEPITPYLMEFHLSTVLSLFRLWQRRQKDLPPKELLDLVFRLYTSGISAIIKKD